jgi:hypothetical protein
MTRREREAFTRSVNSTSYGLDPRAEEMLEAIFGDLEPKKDEEPDEAQMSFVF